MEGLGIITAAIVLAIPATYLFFFIVIVLYGIVSAAIENIFIRSIVVGIVYTIISITIGIIVTIGHTSRED